jgi:excisionase family DNA binding protein
MARREVFLRVTEAAAFLNVSPNTIRNWGRDAKLPEYRHPLNNYRLFKRSDLEKVLRKLLTPIPVTARSRNSR